MTTSSEGNFENLDQYDQIPSYFEPKSKAPSGYYFKTIQLERVPVSRYLHENSEISASATDDMDVEDFHSQDSNAKGLCDCFKCCEPKKKTSKKPASKLGTWDGVFISCLANIFGVILYLRLTWIVGQVGTIQTTMIIILAATVIFITTLSMSAVASNGMMKGGGAYFLISRSLGPEFGGSIGILFSIGSSVAVSLYVIGFAETLSDIFVSNFDFQIFENVLWDIRLFGIATVIVLFIMVLFGVGWISKVQFFLLGILFISMLSIVIGAFLKPNPEEGFVGFLNIFNDNKTTLIRNLDSYAASNSTEPISFEQTIATFFSMFAIYFPAVTGIMAGTNISGDLKKPSANIPTGTLSAIGVTTLVYIILAWTAGSVGVFEVPSFPAEIGSPGLTWDYYFFAKISVWGPIIYIGIFSATLSPALTSMVGAPRILQAVCKDKIFNFAPVNFFAKGNGPKNEPIRGYFFTFVIAACCIMIGDLNLIAPLISMFFMMTYSMINFACFAGSASKQPGWRPAFQFYNPWVSLFGSALCIVAMFLINVVYAVVALVILVMLYIFLIIKKPKVSWGSAGDGLTVTNTIKNHLKLRKKEAHVKNFRPNFLVLTQDPENDLSMIKLIGKIRNKCKGLLICAHIVLGDFHADSKIILKTQRDKLFLEEKIKGHYYPIVAQNYRQCVQTIHQIAGIGNAVEPNTIVIPYLEKWKKESIEVQEEYVNVIRDCFELRKSAIIMRGSDELQSVKLSGRIDIWWLVDDGGLPLLLAYLLKTKYSKLDIRVMVIPTGVDSARHTILITQMLKQFRIEASVEVAVIDESEVDPKDIKKFSKRLNVKLDQEQKTRTLRYFLLRSAIKEHSGDSTLNIISMPFPRLAIAAPVWLGWVEMISRGLPPTMFIRGNNENVLTYYV